MNDFPTPQIFASYVFCPKLLLLFLLMKQGLSLQVFPRLTKCTFYNYGSSGTIQAHDALCVLALNIINEKVKPFSNVVFTPVVFTVIIILLFPHFSRFTSPSGSGLWSWRLWPAPTSSTSWVGYYLHLYVDLQHAVSEFVNCVAIFFWWRIFPCRQVSSKFKNVPNILCTMLLDLRHFKIIK